MRHKITSIVFGVLLLSFAIGCGAGGTHNGGTTTISGQNSNTVFIVVMENKNYDEVVGNTAMPYFNSQIPKGALATNYFANVHPSIGNYFMMTTGIPFPVDDNFVGVVSVDNIARELVAANKTWKVYAESIPSVGYTGGDVMPYLKRHNPFSYFSDVQNGSAQASNMVPLTQLATDISGGNLPNLVFIVPNAFDDGHTCTAMVGCTTTAELQQSDGFMQNVFPLIMNSAGFKNNGVLVVTWDEAEDTDLTNGGGHVPTLFLGPGVKTNFQSTTAYQHQDLLRMMCSRLGLSSAPGAGAVSSTMSEFFK